VRHGSFNTLQGTLVMLWGDKLGRRLEGDDGHHDIKDKTVHDLPIAAVKWREHKVSLRRCLALLYYVDQHTPPPLQIILMSRLVEQFNWTAKLHQQGPSVYMPKEGAPAVHLLFGHTVKLKEPIASFGKRHLSVSMARTWRCRSTLAYFLQQRSR
jgi:hypothetical protein